MPPPNLSHLVVLAAVARHSSFRKAADEVGISTSAVSHAIRGLEERLGVTLFNRTTRSIALTDAGARLLDRMRPALQDLGDALEEMNQFRDKPAGTLRINTSRSAAYLALAPLVPRYLAAYPDIRIELVEQDDLVDIVAGGFDAGVRFERAIPEDMVAVPIGPRRRFAVVASPGYLSRHARPSHPDDLLDHECICYRYPSGKRVGWSLQRKEVAREIDVPGRVTIGDPHLAVRMALDGVGLAYVYEEDVAAAVESGRLVRVLEDWCPMVPGFALYFPKQRRISSALRAFIDMARMEPQSPSPPDTPAQRGKATRP
jgi:DNA-binding transcriptional LysR family regulator